MTARVLIIGDTPWGRRVGADLATHGVETLLLARGEAAPSPGITKVVEGADLSACRGTPGDFTLTLKRNGQRITETADAVVVAEAGERGARFGLYGLTPASNTLSLSRVLRGEIPESLLGRGKTAVFLHGITEESRPVLTGEVMGAAVDLAETHGVRPYILTGNLKVARNGLERRYRTARKAGVVFAKFTRDLPRITQEGTDIRIQFTDEVTRKPFRLTPDLVIVDETLVPSDRLPDLGRTLGLHSGPDGFLQADNVRRLDVLTNRKGIFVVGPARSPRGAADPMADAEAAVVALLSSLGKEPDRPETLAEINRKMCVRCLTCYRTCPYRAIGLYPDHLAVLPAACEGCGICAAECPREAIGFGPFDLPEITARIDTARRDLSTRTGHGPFIVAFCCQRSASQARESALASGWQPPAGLFSIDVPCAGTISQDHLFSALHQGADGVMVITCHPDNCHSETGNLRARQRADGVTRLLNQTGVGSDRIRVATLAANMGAAFARLIDDFNRQIADPGSGQLGGTGSPTPT